MMFATLYMQKVNSYMINMEKYENWKDISLKTEIEAKLRW